MWSFYWRYFCGGSEKNYTRKRGEEIFGWWEKKESIFFSGGKSENAKWKQKEKKIWRKVEKKRKGEEEIYQSSIQ